MNAKLDNKEIKVLKCINSDKQKVLKEGNFYTVLKLDGDRVYINEYKRFSFLLSRFEVVKI